MNLLGGKKKAKAPYVVMVAKEEWTEADAKFVETFTSSKTFGKLRAVLDGYLVDQILQGRSEDFRLGWQTAIRQLAAFEMAEKEETDSKEMTSIQDFK